MDEPESWQQMVQRIARDHGHTLTEGEADFVLWERTSFPFGTQDDIEATVEAEVIAWLGRS